MSGLRCLHSGRTICPKRLFPLKADVLNPPIIRTRYQPSPVTSLRSYSPVITPSSKPEPQEKSETAQQISDSSRSAQNLPISDKSSNPHQTENLPTTQQTQTSATVSSPSPQLPYHVSRTGTNNFPVYTEIRNHGTNPRTLIRKVSGDVEVLRQEIADLIGVDEKRCWVKRPAGHIYLKGHYKTKIVHFLLGKGF